MVYYTHFYAFYQPFLTIFEFQISKNFLYRYDCFEWYFELFISVFKQPYKEIIKNIYLAIHCYMLKNLSQDRNWDCSFCQLERFI